MVQTTLNKFSLEEKEHSLAAKLSCYASGSGAIHFSFLRRDHEGRQIATGDKVTVRDVQWFIKNREVEQWRGWYIGVLSCYAGPILFQRVERVSSDELKLWNTRVVRYEGSGSLLRLWTLDEADTHEIHHLSTKAAVRLYLENENELDQIILKGGL